MGRMIEPFAPYRSLLRRTAEIARLNGAAELLSWDQETYMPPKAIHYRAEQIAHLAGLTHRLFTSRAMVAWIAACEDHGFPADSVQASNVREWRRLYDRMTRVPARLVEAMQRTRAHAREAWVEARRRSQYSLFAPHLEKILDLTRQMADCWGYARTPYDALLDEYEPGASTAALRQLFDQLVPTLTRIVAPAAARSAKTPRSLIHGHYPIAAQQAFNREVAEAIGFDFEAGRVDTTAHPFCCSPGPGDCRLTTRYDERDFFVSLYGVLHEAGHGLYDQGLPVEHHGTPCGSPASLGIHESQSRLWENHVGRAETFWRHWYPRACHYFPDLARLTPEQIAGAANHVTPSFIRVEADQVTYDLHVALRFQIELDLVESRLKVADVPAAWNERFEKLIGLRVPDDARGCLQDVHWSHGSFGYFPTYTIGNLNAAQLMDSAVAEVPGLDAALSHGDYAPLLGWLRERVHRHGHRYNPQELMRRVTGHPTCPEHHLAHLETRFLG